MPYFINKLKQKIAYKRVKGHRIGIVFIHGLNSDMNGKKALIVEKYAKKHNLAFIRFDYRGHGKSFGNFEDFNISDWKQDLIDIIDNLTSGPQILIGSSIGGWLMMLAARSRKSRIKGMIGLAAAPDCDKDLYKSLTKKNKSELKKYGKTKYNLHGFSYTLKKKFFTQAKKFRVLNKQFKYNKPLILIHGLKDDVVSKKIPEKIINKVSSNIIKVIYLKNGDHRLSKKEDLEIIKKSIELIR